MAASMIKHFSKGARVLAGQVWRSAPRVKDAGETSLVHKFSTLNLETVDRGSTVMRQGVCGASTQRSLLEVCQPFKTTIRTKIRYSKLNKDKTARPVVRRFYRLDWGAWIRTRCGRGKKRFQKSAERKRRLDQHVFCNKQQNKLLDQLVTPFWRRKMFFVDDPYAPYQKRHHIPKYYKEKPVFLP
uniref:Large ribosomal subunit protein bL35m n=2 Tax=Magallana TaxID=2171616 RepID=K1QXV7_MAGGI|nr:39S ribosomal protein L35, mitochondrial [Crassostrea gigas]